MHRKPSRSVDRFIVAMGWLIAVTLVMLFVPPAFVVIMLQGLWQKLAVDGHVEAVMMFLRQARAGRRSGAT
jgi:uncharacterized membrane protein YdfJ with MMPL/SSD domain